MPNEVKRPCRYHVYVKDAAGNSQVKVGSAGVVVR
jgi:hypothetical protein